MRQYLTAQRAAEAIERGARVYVCATLFPSGKTSVFGLCRSSEEVLRNRLATDPDAAHAETLFTFDFDRHLILHQPEN